jgi:hypothetical protein
MSAGYGVSQGLFVRLKTDLYAIKSRGFKFLEAPTSQPKRTGDQVGEKACGAGFGNEFLKVLALQRLAS